MALIKSFPHPNGGVSSYWKIISLYINAIEGRANITLAGFMDKASRLSGAHHRSGATHNVVVEGEAFRALASAVVSGRLFDALAKAAYTVIKTRQVPSGKVDDEGNLVFEDWIFADAKDDL